jgi:hypothetical protein
MLQEVLDVVRTLRNEARPTVVNNNYASSPVEFFGVRSSLVQEAIKFAAGATGLTMLSVQQKPEGPLILEAHSTELQSEQQRSYFAKLVVGAGELLGVHMDGIVFIDATVQDIVRRRKNETIIRLREDEGSAEETGDRMEPEEESADKADRDDPGVA